MRKIRAADLFCGAGGISLGLGRACERLGRPVDLVAVNHWPVAVASHERNHPWARHYCSTLELVDPRRLVPSGHLDIIVAGVECTHHSRARGGKPMSDQSRSSARNVLDWTDVVEVRNVLLENVIEFRDWGPLDEDDRPIKAQKGVYYRELLDGFRARGYWVDERVIVCADHGDATTRRRLFIRCSLDGPVRWPEPTHHRRGENGLEPWRTAREIIDWSDLGGSIFRRKRPLARRTVDRIAEGIRRFCGPYTDPFLVMLYGSNTVRSVDRPMPTVTGGGQHIAVATPFLFQANQGNKAGSRTNPIDEPLGTVVAKNHLAIVSPFVVAPDGPRRHREVQAPTSIDLPLPTVRAERGGGHLVTAAFVLAHDQWKRQHGAGGLVDSVDEPLRTIKASSTSAGGCLVTAAAAPFLLRHDQFTARNGALVDSIDDPLATVKARAGAASQLVVPFLVPHFGEREGQSPRIHSLDEPVPTVCATKGAGSLVSPFLVPYYGTGVADGVDEPLATVTARDRFALAAPAVDESAEGYYLDIFFRMLKPRELAAAQGFPADFEFAGNKGEVVRQIGNAVPVNTAEHLCYAALAS